MPRFGKRSLLALDTCHLELQRLCNDVVRHVDCAVLCGHRGEEDQDEAFDKGRSKLQFPKSKHNAYPSMAVDLVPYPVDWSDMERFRCFGGFVMWRSSILGLTLRWGHDFNGNGDLFDQRFVDGPHFELQL